MKKIDVIILGGSGLLGKEIIKLFIKRKFKILNLDLTKTSFKSKFYYYKKFDMSYSNIETEINNIFNYYSVPKIFIDTSYINKNLFKETSFKNFNRLKLNKILNEWLSSSITISRLIIRKMKINKIKGKIILTSSIYGVVAQDPNLYENTQISENIAYSTVKSSILSFVKNAAVQYGAHGITINSVSPGGIINKKDKNFKNKFFVKNYLKKVPLNRFPNPKEIANIYEFLGSEKNTYITGMNIIADGGFTLT